MIHLPIPVVFFKEDGSGNEPVKEWFQSLNKEERRIIGKDLRTVQIGWPLGMPLVRSMGPWLMGNTFYSPKWNSAGLLHYVRWGDGAPACNAKKDL